MFKIYKCYSFSRTCTLRNVPNKRCNLSTFTTRNSHTDKLCILYNDILKKEQEIRNVHQTMCQFTDIRKIKCLNYFSAYHPYQFILIVNEIR